MQYLVFMCLTGNQLTLSIILHDSLFNTTAHYSSQEWDIYMCSVEIHISDTTSLVILKTVFVLKTFIWPDGAALWRRSWGSWWTTNCPRVSSALWPRRPMVTWDALGSALPVGQGRQFRPSTQPCTSGVLCPALHFSARGRRRAPGVGPVDSNKDEEGMDHLS